MLALLLLLAAAPDALIAELMAKHKVPGVSVAVLRGGKVAEVKGYGELVAGGGTAVNPETVFQAASISKPVAALGALHMVENGNFTLDEDVNGRLKSWKVPPSSHLDSMKVTLRGLLNHSAGLTVHGFPGYAAGEALPSIGMILDGAKPANTRPVLVDIEPGSTWRYSGGGFTVMQLLMTERPRAPFAQLMQNMVLGRLGMRRSTYEQPLPAAWHANAARAHTGDGLPLSGGWHNYPEQAAAGLWTTPGDLALVLIEVREAWHGRSQKVIGKDMARAMLTRGKGEYGLGFGLETVNGETAFGHGGSNRGFQCRARMLLTSGDGFVVMTNSDNGGRMIGELLQRMAAKE